MSKRKANEADSFRKLLAAFDMTHQARFTELGVSLAGIIGPALRRRGWSTKKLAAKCGVSESLIQKLIGCDDANPTLRTISRILNALGIRVRFVEAPAKEKRK